MNQSNNSKISGCGGQIDNDMSGKFNQSQREIYYDSAVEGPLFGDYDLEPLSYDHDLALSREHALALAPTPVSRSGFAEFDENNDLKLLKSHCLSDLRKKPILMPTKSLGVTFSEPVELKFYATGKSEKRSSPKFEDVSCVRTDSVSANSNSNTAAVEAAPLTNLAFYQMKPNCEAVDNMIALAGAGQFCVQFQLDGMQTVWDMTEDPTLLAFLHERGATSSILLALSEASGSATSNSSVQFDDFEDSTSYESAQVLTLAMLALCNLSKCPPAMEQIANLELSALEKIVSYCSRFINNRGVSPHPRDAYLGKALRLALDPSAVAAQCHAFIGALLAHLQDANDSTLSNSSGGRVSAVRGNVRLMQDLGRICTAASRPCSVPSVTITSSG